MRVVILSLLLTAPLALADDAKSLLDEARAAVRRNELDAALKLADRVLAQEPKNADAYLLRGTIQTARRQFDAAVADFTKTLELAPTAYVAYDRRGTAYFKQGKAKQAVADYDRYVDKVPRAGPGHWQRGLALYYAGEFARGVEQFRTSDRESPGDVENAVWHFLCNVHVKGIEKARAGMLPVDRDPRGPYFLKIHDLFRGKAQPEDVFALAEAGEVPAERRTEQRFYANYYVGMYYEALGDRRKAREYISTAVTRYPIGHYMMDVARVHLSSADKP